MVDQNLSKFDDFGVFGKLTIEIYPNLVKLIWVNDPKFAKIENLGLGLRIPKFGFLLGLRISNFRFHQNLTKIQNFATVVYHKLAISPILTKLDFAKILSQYGRTNSLQQPISKIILLAYYKKQNWLFAPKFWWKFLKLLTLGLRCSDPRIFSPIPLASNQFCILRGDVMVSPASAVHVQCHGNLKPI